MATAMARVEVRDYVLWIKHIHGDDALREKLGGLSPGEVVTLLVDGREGLWRKVGANRSNGSAVAGLAPIGPAKSHWGELFRAHKAHGGTVVEVVMVDERQGSGNRAVGFAEASGIFGAASSIAWEEASEADREAAWRAFKDLWKAGWRSTAPYGSRDELYERD
jgi:hypothetical protein